MRQRSHLRQRHSPPQKQAGQSPSQKPTRPPIRQTDLTNRQSDHPARHCRTRRHCQHHLRCNRRHQTQDRLHPAERLSPPTVHPKPPLACPKSRKGNQEPRGCCARAKPRLPLRSSRQSLSTVRLRPQIVHRPRLRSKRQRPSLAWHQERRRH